MSVTMPATAAPNTVTDGLPVELICLILKHVVRNTRCYHIKKVFAGRRKTPQRGQWLVPVATRSLSTALLIPDFNELFYDELLKSAMSAKKPTKMAMHMLNLDFRPLVNFLKTGLSTTQTQTISQSPEPKIIAILEFNDDELKSKEFGRWISFVATSNIRIDYVMGDAKKPDTVAFQLQELLSVFEHSDDMKRIYKACMIAQVNLRAATNRVEALYEDLSEVEANADDQDAVDRATAAQDAEKEMGATLAKKKAWKGSGIGAMVGLKSAADADPDEDEDEDGDVDGDEDGSMDEEESDSDPENMSDVED